MLPVATADGDLFRGPHLVSGGLREDARGILETKRHIKDLRARIAGERDALGRLTDEAADFEALDRAGDARDRRAQRRAPPAREGHRRPTRRSCSAPPGSSTRLQHKAEQLSRERRQAEEEREALDGRQDEARRSIVRLDGDQRAADERLTLAQRACSRRARAPSN